MSDQHKSDAVFIQSLNSRIATEWRWFVAGIVLLTAVLTIWGNQLGLSRLNNVLYDFALISSRGDASPQDVVIINIDDASIEKLGYWPWRRATHAALLAHLQDARVVGFDLLFPDINPSYPRDDDLLAAAIGEHGRVVLAEYIDPDSGLTIKPLPKLARMAAQRGVVNTIIDDDGLVRRVQLQPSDGKQTSLHFSSAVYAAGQEKSSVATPAGQLSSPSDLLTTEAGESASNHAELIAPTALLTPSLYLIPYVGRAGSFPMVSYHQVLSGQIPAETFKDKYVLVGAWAAGMGDVFSVPTSFQGQPMAGVEVLANSLQALLSDRWIYLPPLWASLLFALIPVLVICLGLRRVSPRQAFFGSLLTIVFILLASFISLRFFSYWFEPVAGLIGVMLAYPLWSWRSQEAALWHIDRELHRLDKDNLLIGQTLRSDEKRLFDRSLPARIQALYKGVGMLRRAVRQREETLRFLSHDMRSPQSAILALTQLQRDKTLALPEPEVYDQIDRYAHTTLGLVDGFVQFARAESVGLQLRPVNLVDCLHEACDSRWPRAQAKQMSIDFEPLRSVAWVEADEQMLLRVFGNLLDNAINYSPAGTNIHCRLVLQEPFWLVTISDEGEGIAPDDLKNIFLPFSRGQHSPSKQPEGSGLGLAYVYAVVSRLQGEVDVDSTLGVGSTFFIRLPVLYVDE
ncbi:MAG TPA: CHASE2 domain-containing protein [Burkholderiaceae bacterium]|nr:CHASE2 domain-containing protein [Burkholderiaceae bacterium]